MRYRAHSFKSGEFRWSATQAQMTSVLSCTVSRFPLTHFSQIYVAGLLYLSPSAFHPSQFTIQDWPNVCAIGQLELVLVESPDFTLCARDLLEEIDLATFSDNTLSLPLISSSNPYMRTNFRLAYHPTQRAFRITQPSAVVCHTACSSTHKNIYAPQIDSMRWCQRCSIWFHTACLRIARPQRLGDGAIEPEEWNIAWSAPPPHAPGHLQWQILLRTPIQRIPQRGAHGPGGPASIELALFAVRRYHMEHNRPPSSLQTWLQPYVPTLDRAGVLFHENPEYRTCPTCHDRI
ncbi:hypothetical protein VTO73DRAFT_9898 [Trametes versicolor]